MAAKLCLLNQKPDAREGEVREAVREKIGGKGKLTKWETIHYLIVFIVPCEKWGFL